MKKIEKKKIEFVLIIIALIQCFLLINMNIAHSYILYETNPLINSINFDKPFKNIIQSGLNLLIGFLSIKQIGIVSATSDWCCLETDDGASCQPIDTAIQSQLENCISSNTKQQTCSNIDDCDIGYCFSPNEGFCSYGSTRKECLDDGGEFYETENTGKCREGCCVAGINSQWVTEDRCSILTDRLGFGHFDFGISQASCIFFSEEEGACIARDGACSRKTEDQCNPDGSNIRFVEGFLCSHPGLKSYDVACEKQDHIGCSDNKDIREIYWFDSCGNRENIYEGNNKDDKDESNWDGLIKDKGDSCSPSGTATYPANINNPNCGNCGYNFMSKCAKVPAGEISVDEDNFVCVNLGCVDPEDDTKKWKNGESWCVYDGVVGESLDTVGSRHWKRYCDNGEVGYENCDDYRKEICSEQTQEDFKTAVCRPNQGFKCLLLEEKEACDEVSDCRMIDVDLGKDFNFEACVPKYPIGFDVNSGDSETNGGDMCALMGDEDGKITCTWIEQKKPYWEVVLNDNCDDGYKQGEEQLIKQMNDFCISLGDCGGYINYVEEYTSRGFDFYHKGDTRKEHKGVKKNEANFNREYQKELHADEIQAYKDGASDSPEYIASATDWINPDDLIIIEEDIIGGISSDYQKAMTGTQVGMSASAAVIGLLIKAGVIGGIGGPIGWVTAALIVVVAAFLMIFGVGKENKVKMIYECKPWKPPYGGDDCETCNDDPLKPCSKYRCESLGTDCGFIDDAYYEQSNPPCVCIHCDDPSAPVITFADVGGDYQYSKKIDVDGRETGVEINKSNGECVQTGTGLNFTLETDDFAVCSWSFDRTNLNEADENYFVEEEFFSKKHVWDSRIYSRRDVADVYVRCTNRGATSNVGEYIVRFCVTQIPDIKAPVVDRVEPEISYLKYGETSKLIRVFFDEAARCKYDFNEGLSYEAMAYTMFSCDVDNSTFFLDYSCEENIQNLIEPINNIYIKCEDINGGNEMTKDYPYTIYATEEELTIDYIFPEEGSTIIGHVPVELEVETSGGMNDGAAICSYEFIETGWNDFFTTTGLSHHEYIFTSLPAGDYGIEVTCKDDIQNQAIKSTNFDIWIDDDPPIVVRAFKGLGGQLTIITNEDATCYFNKNFNSDDPPCGFEITNETESEQMTSVLNQHTTPWIAGQTYYIKCVDLWDVKNSDCAITIEPSLVN